MKNFFGHKNYILPFQGANRYYRQSSQGVAIGLKYKWFSTIPNAPKGHYNPTLVEMQAALPIRNKMKDSVLNNNE
ncbi:MAG: hypothetical protein FWF65_08645, partial [Bacteroidetes bacterium]|nr:hypothetical protein [Bacteroidota bacterium]